MSDSNNYSTMFKYLLKSARLWQWIKSSFLLVPALFTLEILNRSHWGDLATGVFGFSLVASSIYIFNDIINKKEDRQHPIKSLRPIASGMLKSRTAGIFSISLAAIGLFLLIRASENVALFGVYYVLIMVLYTIYFRRLYIVDVIFIAVGFVLRVEAGAALIDQPVSHWLLLCTFTIALFLGMIKRRQEIGALGGSHETHSRKVLADYPPLQIIDGWINILAAITLMCYALYTVDPATIAKHHTNALIYTLPFAFYGIFRYQKISLFGRGGEDPTKLVISDIGIRFAVILWVVTVGIILYLAKSV